MNVRLTRLRKWRSCRAIGLGVTAERLTMGTTVDDPRPIIDYVITLTLLTRELTLRHSRRLAA
jgi:hypothetical protein